MKWLQTSQETYSKERRCNFEFHVKSRHIETSIHFVFCSYYEVYHSPPPKKGWNIFLFLESEANLSSLWTLYGSEASKINWSESTVSISICSMFQGKLTKFRWLYLTPLHLLIYWVAWWHGSCKILWSAIWNSIAFDIPMNILKQFFDIL